MDWAQELIILVIDEAVASSNMCEQNIDEQGDWKLSESALDLSELESGEPA